MTKPRTNPGLLEGSKRMYSITIDIIEDLAGYRVSFHAWAHGGKTPKTLSADVWFADSLLSDREGTTALLHKAVQDVTHTAAEALLRVAAGSSLEDLQG